MSPFQMNAAITGVRGTAEGQHVQRKPAQKNANFANVLESQMQAQTDVKMSAHAQKRLAERNVQFSDAEQARLNTAVDRIGQKGADKSLVLMDDLALLVSAKNRTVITAVDSASAKDGVFTNIDSAIII